MNRIFLLLLSVLVMSGCTNNNETDKANNVPKLNKWTPPAAGNIIDQYEERIADDKLNNSSFKVIIIATPTSNQGHFDLQLEYGANKNETSIDLPELKMGTILKPVLKKGNAKYECLIGFDAGDGAFKEFYLVSVEDKNIKLKKTYYYYSAK